MSFGPERAARDRRRVFYALWPTAPVRDALAARIASLAAGAPARWIPPGNLHLTLWFVGAVAPGQLQRLLSAPAMPGAAMTLVLIRLRYLQRRHILWLEPEGPVPALSVLVAGLIDRSGFETLAGDRQSLSPHVTLGRKLFSRALLRPEVEPVTWPVDSYALVESLLQPSGPPRYRVLRQWPLRSMPAAGSMK